MTAAAIPDPALLVLIGASGSGKSTWALEHYRRQEVVSSDDLRGLVGSGPHDLDASAEAFDLLDRIVAGRLRRGLTTVVDTLGLDRSRRTAYLALARAAGLPAVAVLLDTPPGLARTRNSARDRPVPAAALTGQLRQVREVAATLAAEPWDLVVRVGSGGGAERRTPAAEPAGPPAASPAAAVPAGGLVLQLSRFPWGEDPLAWLRDMATAAEDAGFAGLALMDHLIQIPQVDRAWSPIPEPFTTLGLLAGLDTGLWLGTLCTPVTFRPAGVLAKAFATLDVLTGGRAFCGIGAGWWEREHLVGGQSMPPVGRRMDVLESTVETMRALWAPGTKPYDGEHVSLPETTLYPRPVGPLPVIVGGRGERRTLRIAARWGDACNVPSDPDVVAHKTAVLRRHCAEVGRDPAEVAVTVLDLPVLGRDRDDVWAKVEGLRGRTPAAAYARTHHAGTVAEHQRRLGSLRDTGVGTVFVSPPGLAAPEDVAVLAPLARG